MAQDEPEQPLSAINWLSDSVSETIPTARSIDPVPKPVQVSPVTVSSLTSLVPDRAGTLDADQLGLEPGLWGASSAQELVTLLEEIPKSRSHVIRKFLSDLLVARLTPPVDAITDDRFFLARVDALLALGRLDQAETILREAGINEPNRFRRLFDIALLNSTEAEACSIIESSPDISPTFPARIFCLARNGEWEVAALTLGTAEALGILSEEEDALLLHFLDPELFEGEPLPIPPATISPLMFRLYEAVGARLPTERLPTAFSVADMSTTVGWKTRLGAVERLFAAGAIDSDEFLDAFSERKPAASGGIWNRVDAIQELSSAFNDSDVDKVSAVLPGVWLNARQMNYSGPLAPWLLEQLEGLELDPGARHTAFEIALLASDLVRAKEWADGGSEDRTLLSVAEGRPFAIGVATPLARAIQQSFFGQPPSDRYRMDLEDNRNGAALLTAVATLSGGTDSDPFALGDALAVFRSLGLETTARAIAVELLLEASQI